MNPTCSLPTCKEPATTQLHAEDGAFPFCAHHATTYEALGYKRAPAATDEDAGGPKQLSAW